jgi:hypothetical protein
MEESRFAGVDWASEEHAVCALDAEGGIVQGRRYRQDERGIRTLCARPIHPSQVAAMRPQFTVAGDRDVYDPARHTARQRLTTTTA